MTANTLFRWRLLLLIGFAASAAILAHFPPPAAAAGADADSRARVLRSASELDYPPFALVRPDGSADGFSVDLLKAVAREAGLGLDFAVGPWHEIKQRLQDRQLDVLPLVSYSEERERFFDFTVPYLRMHGTIFVRRGATGIRGEGDLQGKEVLVMQGDTCHEYALRNKLTDRLVVTETYEQAMRLLSSGKHDAVLVQQVVGWQLIRQLGITNLEDIDSAGEKTLRPAGGPLSGFEQKFCFAVQKGDAALLARLNEGLAIVFANGVYDRLYEKWFGPILPRPAPTPIELVRTALYILLPVLLVFTAGGYWLSRRQVRSKTASLVAEVKERRKAEESMHESEERFRMLFENAPLAYQSLDEHGLFLDVNRKWLESLGYGKDEVIGKWFGEFLEPGSRELFSRSFPVFKQECVIDGVEFNMVRRDGGSMTVSLNGRVQLDEHGRVDRTHCIFTDITERKRAEEALREAQNRANLMATLLDDSSQPFAIGYPDGRLGMCNQAYLDLLGCTREEYETLDWAKTITPPEWLPGEMAALAELERTGRPAHYEKEYVRRDGTRVPVELLVHMHRDESGRPEYYYGFVTDISERKQSEEALSESLARFRDVFEHSPLGMLIIDRTGVIQAANPRMEELLPPPAGGYPGTNLLDIAAPGPARDAMRLALAAGEGVLFDDWYQSRSGVRVSIRVNYIRLPNGMIMAQFEDLTVARQAEDALRRTEALLRTMLKNLPLDFWARDLDGRVIIQSDICRDNWGDLDMARQEEDCIPAETLARWKANNARALAGETVEGEHEYVLPSADRAYYHEIVAPIRDRGEVLGVMGVNVDLTDRFTMEEELRASMAAAEAASRTKTEFLATMSHEIRTPLNGVLGMLQLTQTTDLTAEQAEYVGTALQSGRSLLRVLSDVLDISRIEAGALTIVAENFRPAEVFGPILNAFEGQTRAKGLGFACALGPGLPDLLCGDAGRIRQVAYNLVGNALKYTAKGEVLLEAFTLPAAAQSGGVRLHLAVSDTGIGVPADKVHDIFEAFTQLDGSYTRRYGGTGLGLTIVKRLVGLMNGSIEFCSRPGEGTDVHVVLPLEIACVEARAMGQPQASPELQAPARSLAVLLAEDDRVNRLTVSHMLAKAGHRAHEVGNGAEAVAFLAANAVDCVLMDIQMPEMDGMEATRRIRQGEAGEASRTVPIIALTAHAMKGDREQFLAAGMDGYLAKPVDMGELERMLSDMAARRGG